MPRDKSATHEKLIPIIRREFTQFGYEKASLQHIASQAGITAAGLYRHYSSKEEMFASLVEDTVDRFLDFWDQKIDQALQIVEHENFIDEFSGYRANSRRELIDLIYNDYDNLKLLFLKSHGTRFESFEDQLIDREYKAITMLLESLDRHGIPHNDITENKVHILSTTFIITLSEAIKHDYTKKEACEHLDFVSRFLVPGFREVLGF